MRNLKSKFSEFCKFENLPERGPRYPLTYFGDLEDHEQAQADLLDFICIAHDKILEGKSPYLAWAEIRGFTEGDLSALLDIDCFFVKMLLKNPELSPPKYHVDYFCREIGVHPAYLQPCLNVNNHSYHFSVVSVLADIALDEECDDYERQLARRALSTEVKKYKEFEQGHPAHATFLNQAFEYWQKNSNPLDADIETILDFYERKLQIQLEMDSRKIRKDLFEPRTRFENSEAQLFNIAQALFGCLKANENIDQFMENIKEFRPEFEEDIEWDFQSDNQLLISSSRWEFLSPLLDKNWQKNAVEQLHLMPQEAIRDFIDLAPWHLERTEAFEKVLRKVQPRLDALRDPLEAYQSWRYDVANQWQPSFFMNYKIAEIILASDKEEIRANLPAVINHRYDYVFPHLQR